jgi:hypothetical protein
MATMENNKTLTLQDLGRISQHLQQLNDNGLIHVKTSAMPDFHSIVATLNLVATGKMELVEVRSEK